MINEKFDIDANCLKIYGKMEKGKISVKEKHEEEVIKLFHDYFIHPGIGKQESTMKKLIKIPGLKIKIAKYITN